MSKRLPERGGGKEVVEKCQPRVPVVLITKEPADFVLFEIDVFFSPPTFDISRGPTFPYYAVAQFGWEFSGIMFRALRHCEIST